MGRVSFLTSGLKIVCRVGHCHVQLHESSQHDCTSGYHLEKFLILGDQLLPNTTKYALILMPQGVDVHLCTGKFH